MGDKFQNFAPTISLPKGGGAIKGIGEKFAANPVTGTASLSVPIYISPGRSGFGPQLSLSYDSGAGNGPFGFGWNLSLPSITRKTDKGLPRYLDAIESDVFILSGSEDLVPEYEKGADDKWVFKDGRHVIYEKERTVNGFTYTVRRYRPRIEGLFARIERWTRGDGDVHWRSISKDNILTIYGRDDNSRIFDPEDSKRVFSWLICETRDDKGNAVLYEYKPEDGTGIDLTRAYERNRGVRDDKRRSANRYLKRIKYGNRTSLLDEAGQRPPQISEAQIESAGWMFEVVFDYDDHDPASPKPRDDKAEEPEGVFKYPWKPRQDPFSTYRSGFEIRTCRLCQRVLMFHHFPNEGGVGADCLVRSTDFHYSCEQDPKDARNPVYTFLCTVTQSGYKRRNGGYLKRSLPPIEFQYTQPIVQDKLEEVDSASLENLPSGVDGAVYQWTDLHGEGIPGILTEQEGAWYFKSNLSPINKEQKVEFAPQECVAVKPNLALAGGAQFMDLAGDGQLDLVVLDGPTPGLYEHDENESWQPFRPFTSRLNRNMRDSNLKLVDLDGDGHADVLITEDDAFVWHTSLAEAGFGPAQRVAQSLDEEKGPRVVLADGTQSIYLADLSGDGLTDLVRIRNGEVCYWPNLGYGRFGAKITMDNILPFDQPNLFDHKRLRLADIDGSGTTDIIYLHRDGVRLYFNQSGNSWSTPEILSVFPQVDDIVNIVPTDLLGNGTACLVWSSPLLGDAWRPMRYVNLMGGKKPHLLERAINNLGAETFIQYAPSTKFYLADKLAGKPWITRLPFPVHVVERVETYEHISRNRFVTRYAYHHGYFDGEEREFRGFGMVEQRDTEEIGTVGRDKEGSGAANWDQASFVPPVHTKTWFHTGAYQDRELISHHYAGEYFREPGLSDLNPESQTLLLPDTILPTGLMLEEEREACRALKGMMLRQEVYAEDAKPESRIEAIRRAKTPYTVTEQNFTIRRLQPRQSNKHGVFFAHPREAINYHYERNPADPRIAHTMTLDVDDFGNVLKSASIGYGRRENIIVLDEKDQPKTISNPGLGELAPNDQEKQKLINITCTENRFTRPHTDNPDPKSPNGSIAIDEPDAFRTPLPAESCTYEVRKAQQEQSVKGRTELYQFEDILAKVTQAGDGRHDIAYEDLEFKKTKETVQNEPDRQDDYFRRLIEHIRTRYRPNDLGASRNDPLTLLDLGMVQSLALPGESYKLAFTPGLIASVFRRKRTEGSWDDLLSTDSADAILTSKAGDGGGYVDLDKNSHWWIPSGRIFYKADANPADPSATAHQELAEARQHFYLPRKYTDPFGYSTTVDYQYDMLISKTKDALENTVQAVNDYRVLQPGMVTDPNGNCSFAAFDALGLIVATAVCGKEDENLGDKIEDFTQDGTCELANPKLSTLQGFVTDPRGKAEDLLKRASTRIVYDLDRFSRCGQPTFAATLARETHVSELEDDQKTKIQISFSYSDGFGREIQKKIQAEGGNAPFRNPETIDVGGGDIKPGPLVMENGKPRQASTSHRWVGTGRTVFNNKGKPIKQYEPFFSNTHLFEEEQEMTDTGVTPILFYDPVERVIATIHPKNTYEKVVFDSWQQTTFDVNDTVAPRNSQTGDPRTDKDIMGCVEQYFKSLPVEANDPWQTWFQQRINGAKGIQEQQAAKKAEAHADTPTIAHFDALGRPFLTVAHNRVACANHKLDGTEEKFSTRIILDIEGNQREVIDAKHRIVMRYDYYMAGPEKNEKGGVPNRIHQASMEAGERWFLSDVFGKPFRAWDSRGHEFKTEYDALRRPVGRYVRGSSGDSDLRTIVPEDKYILFEKIEYGEGKNEDTKLNLRMRVFAKCDGAGMVTNRELNPISKKEEGYDFKGNLLRSKRELVKDYKNIPDWKSTPELEQEIFMQATRYDALNRPIRTIAPYSSKPGTKINVIQPVFNDANLLEKVYAWLDQPQEPDPAIPTDPDVTPPPQEFVRNIDYNEKGQRKLIKYGNGATTTYDYDPLTFRLKSLFTIRGTGFPQACADELTDEQRLQRDCPKSHPQCKGVQNLHYTFDPAGNITHIRDDAQQTVFFKNKCVEPSNDYAYDAIYRLIEATGREHLGQVGGKPIPHSHNHALRSPLLHPNDGNAMDRYCEKYVYDPVGNFIEMSHHSSCPENPDWSRTYSYNEASLIEDGTGGTLVKLSNRLSRSIVDSNSDNPTNEPYSYDPHGNMTRMPHLSQMQWDFKDQLIVSARQKVNDPECTPETTYYVYDSSGQRVRKVVECYAAEENATTPRYERIYLGGLEIFRQYSGNHIGLMRETLHIMDDKQRIALVETRNGIDDGSPKQLFRYQFGNHLGSAIMELDRQEQIISYEEYSPYGCSTYQAVRSETETLKRFRYTAKERDEETGFYYYGARYYMPSIARWTKCDPEGIQDEINLFIYTHNNPIKFIDKSGTSSTASETEALEQFMTEVQKIYSRYAAEVRASNPEATPNWIGLTAEQLTREELETVFKMNIPESSYSSQETGHKVDLPIEGLIDIEAKLAKHRTEQRNIHLDHAQQKGKVYGLITEDIWWVVNYGEDLTPEQIESLKAATESLRNQMCICPDPHRGADIEYYPAEAPEVPMSEGYPAEAPEVPMSEEYPAEAPNVPMSEEYPAEVPEIPPLPGYPADTDISNELAPYSRTIPIIVVPSPGVAPLPLSTFNPVVSNPYVIFAAGIAGLVGFILGIQPKEHEQYSDSR